MNSLFSVAEIHGSHTLRNGTGPAAGNILFHIIHLFIPPCMLWLHCMNLTPFEPDLDELLEDLVAHHGLSSSKEAGAEVRMSHQSQLVSTVRQQMVQYLQRNQKYGL